MTRLKFLAVVNKCFRKVLLRRIFESSRLCNFVFIVTHTFEFLLSSTITFRWRYKPLLEYGDQSNKFQSISETLHHLHTFQSHFVDLWIYIVVLVIFSTIYGTNSRGPSGTHLLEAWNFLERPLKPTVMNDWSTKWIVSSYAISPNSLPLLPKRCLLTNILTYSIDSKVYFVQMKI